MLQKIKLTKLTLVKDDSLAWQLADLKVYALSWENVFEHGQRGSADKMQTSMNAITKYVGTKFGTDISSDCSVKVYVSYR